MVGESSCHKSECALRSLEIDLLVFGLQLGCSAGTHSSSNSPSLQVTGYSHEDREPQKAFISFTVIFVQIGNFSFPITSSAYLLLFVTISFIRSSLKNISKTSLGDSGIAVAGPTGEGFTSTGFNVLVHVAGGGGESDVERVVIVELVCWGTTGGETLVVVGLHQHQHHLHPVPSLKTRHQSPP